MFLKDLFLIPYYKQRIQDLEAEVGRLRGDGARAPESAQQGNDGAYSPSPASSVPPAAVALSPTDDLLRKKILDCVGGVQGASPRRAIIARYLRDRDKTTDDAESALTPDPEPAE